MAFNEFSLRMSDLVAFLVGSDVDRLARSDDGTCSSWYTLWWGDLLTTGRGHYRCRSTEWSGRLI